MKKFLALLLAALMIFSLVACGGNNNGTAGNDKPSEGNDQPASGGDEGQGSITDNEGISSGSDVNETQATTEISEDAVLRVGMQGEPQQILTYDGGTLGGAIAEMLYDTLIFFDSTTNTYSPKLATSWETIDDCTTRYHLRDDVYTSNGTQLKASDVVYTFRNGLENPSTAPDYSYYDIDNFNIVDDFTIDIKTNAPFANAFVYLAQCSFAIHSEADCEANGGIEVCRTNPQDGSGRYVFKEWKTGEKIVVERNDNYWGDKGYYKTIEVYFIADATTRAFALQSGDVDVITYVNATQAQELAGNPDLKVVAQSAGSMTGLAFNCVRAPFDNPKVREALAYAVNKDAIVQIYTGGYGSAVDMTLPKGNPLYAEIDSSLYYHYDPEHAKELLAEAGYPDGFSFRTILNTSYNKIAEVLQSNFADIGVNMEIDSRELPGWFEASNAGDYDGNLVSFFPGNNIQPFYMMDDRIPYASKGVCQLPSGEWNDILDTLYATPDLDEARVYSKQLTEIFAENLPGVMLVSADYLFAGNANLTGYYANTKCDMLHYDMLRPAA